MAGRLQSLAAGISGRASARRFWRVARAGFPVVQEVEQEPARLRTSYSSDFLYTLTTDEVRMGAFSRAIAGHGARRVLEVGCGPWAPLAEMALASGAERVVLVEATRAHAEAARRRLAREVRRGRAAVLHGRLGAEPLAELPELGLPEGFRPELLVAELLGYTASEEGAPAVFAGLQRRFGPLPTVPRAARSLMAPVRPLALSLGDRWRNWCAHGAWPRPERFAPGRLYDCRFPRGLELAAPRVWEAYDFAGRLEAQLQQRRRLRFRLPAGERAGGLLLWMQADVDEDNAIDTREDETSWNQYYLHLPEQGGGAGGDLVVDVDVDARSEDVTYEFTVGGATYRING